MSSLFSFLVSLYISEMFSFPKLSESKITVAEIPLCLADEVIDLIRDYPADFEPDILDIVSHERKLFFHRSDSG